MGYTVQLHITVNCVKYTALDISNLIQSFFGIPNSIVFLQKFSLLVCIFLHDETASFLLMKIVEQKLPFFLNFCYHTASFYTSILISFLERTFSGNLFFAVHIKNKNSEIFCTCGGPSYSCQCSQIAGKPL